MRADGQVVVVPFDSYKVEVAPAVKLTDGRYWICDTNNGGSWKTVDPASELTRLNESDRRSNSNTRNLIKMTKAWRDNCNAPMKPFWIEILAQDFLAAWTNFDKSTVYYDWMVRDFFAFLYSKAKTHIFPNGTSEWVWLGDGWQSRVLTAYQRAKKACDLEGANKELEASEEWKKIFGEAYFPNPTMKASSILLGRGLLGG